MRQIKFRLWDGYRYTTSGIMFSNTTGCLETPSRAQNLETGMSAKINWAIEQFTGLHDKNGVEIYEGDYIAARGDNKYRIFVRSINQFSGAQFQTESLIQGEWLYLADVEYPCNGLGLRAVDRHLRAYEVIGNVHQNPELMGESDV